MKRRSNWEMAMVLAGLASSASAQDKIEYEVHDARRPVPPVVSPGTFSAPHQQDQAPSDATILFDGKDLSQWESVSGGDAPWQVTDGAVQIVPGSGDIQTRRHYGDAQLHLEVLEPKGTEGRGQERGNSGILLQGLYELQILDNHNNETYADGMAGALYGQYPPLVNACRPQACRPQGEWQTYDIVFHPAKLRDGRLVRPARVTAFFNGVLVQDGSELIGPTGHQILASYPVSLPDTGPLRLQDHGNPVRYRNIWLRELPSDGPPAPVKAAGDHSYEKAHRELSRKPE